MEFLLELILEIVFEGGAELAVDAVGSKKVPLAVRILLAIVIGLVLLACLGLFVWIVISGVTEKKTAMVVAGGIMILLYVGLMVILVRKIRKRYC